MHNLSGSLHISSLKSLNFPIKNPKNQNQIQEFNSSVKNSSSEINRRQNVDSNKIKNSFPQLLSTKSKSFSHLLNVYNQNKSFQQQSSNSIGESTESKRNLKNQKFKTYDVEKCFFHMEQTELKGIEMQKANFLKNKLNQLDSIKNSLNSLKNQMNQVLESKIQSKKLKEEKPQYYLKELRQDLKIIKNSRKIGRFYHHFEENLGILKNRQEKTFSKDNLSNVYEVNRSNFFYSQKSPKLILDLDHDFFIIDQSSKAQSKNPIYLTSDQPGKSSKHQILMRPYLKIFLDQCSKKFEIMVFSSKGERFTKQVLKYIDPQKRYISKVLISDEKYSDKESTQSTKDFSSFKFDSDKTLFITSRIGQYCMHLPNVIPIIPFEGKQNDTQLQGLKKYLKWLGFCTNVAEKNEEYFQYKKYGDYQKQGLSISQFLEKVYQ